MVIYLLIFVSDKTGRRCWCGKMDTFLFQCVRIQLRREIGFVYSLANPEEWFVFCVCLCVCVFSSRSVLSPWCSIKIECGFRFKCGGKIKNSACWKGWFSEKKLHNRSYFTMFLLTRLLVCLSGRNFVIDFKLTSRWARDLKFGS